ncbi:diaminopimelate epimerase [Chloroflexota bacterium]
MRFSKLQATGNDFILVDARTKAAEWPKLAQAMCDRHFGVGADGLMLVENSTSANLKMRLYNSDGSEAEVSGNGLRCFTKYAIEEGLVGNMPLGAEPAHLRLSIETLSGVRKVEACMSGNKVSHVEVNMGSPRFQPEQIPVEVKVDIIPVLNYPLEIDGRELTLCLVSMGNPHAVTFLSQPVADFPLDAIGPKVEMHPVFAQRTNFEVARVLNRRKIEARVWERGVGETLACGSGASAIAVAAQLLGDLDSEADIILRGGALTVSWDRVGEVLLSGPVEEVFAGEWPEEGS